MSNTSEQQVQKKFSVRSNRSRDPAQNGPPYGNDLSSRHAPDHSRLSNESMNPLDENCREFVRRGLGANLSSNRSSKPSGSRRKSRPLRYSTYIDQPAIQDKFDRPRGRVRKDSMHRQRSTIRRRSTVRRHNRHFRDKPGSGRTGHHAGSLHDVECCDGCSVGEATCVCHSNSMFDDEIFGPICEIFVYPRHERAASSPMDRGTELMVSGESRQEEITCEQVCYADRFTQRRSSSPRLATDRSRAINSRNLSTRQATGRRSSYGRSSLGRDSLGGRSSPGRSWLFTGWGQVIVLSLVYFAVIGMWNALNTVGGLGTGDEDIAHMVNTVLYGTGCVGGFFSGSAINLFGLTVGAVVGATAQTLVLLLVYLYHYHHIGGLWMTAIGALIGGAVVSWNLAAIASGAVHYPTERQRSLFLAVNSAFLNAGGVIGSLISLIMNFSQKDKGHSNNSSLSIRTLIGRAGSLRAGGLGAAARVKFDNFGFNGSGGGARRLSQEDHATGGYNWRNLGFFRRTFTMRDGGNLGAWAEREGAWTVAKLADTNLGQRGLAVSTLPAEVATIDHSLLPADPVVDVTTEAESGGVSGLSNASFLVILAINASGILMSLLVQSPSKVRRSDGSIPKVPILSLMEEVHGIIAGLKEPYLWLMAPLFMCSIWHEVVLFNYFNVQLFNVRSRAVNSLCYYLARILASFIFQLVCDMAHTLPKRIDGANIFTLTLCAIGFTTAAMAFGDVFHVKSDAPLDFSEKRSSLLIICFFAYGALETTATSYSLWLIGALPFHNSSLANRYVGWYRTFAALGGFLSWLLDSIKVVNVAIQWAISAALWIIAIICTTYLRHDLATKLHPRSSLQESSLGRRTATNPPTVSPVSTKL